MYRSLMGNKVFESPFTGVISEYLTLKNILLLLIFSLLIGIVLSVTYVLVNKDVGYNRFTPILIITMPIVMSVSIFMITVFIEGNNFARALTLGGLFALIRFRSEPVSIKDMMYLTFSIVCGFVVGMGYFVFAFIACILIILILIVAKLLKYGEVAENSVVVKVLIPENINYDGMFDDVFKKYSTAYRLTKIKTVDFGTLFELRYFIKLKKSVKSKDLLDELRVLNSNLSVTLTIKDQSEI